MTYNCTALTTFQPKKVYLELQKVNFKIKYIITTPSHFETRIVRTAQLSPVMFGKMDKETPVLVWDIIRTTAPETNITGRCSLCLHEKLVILMYLNHIVRTPTPPFF